MISFYTQETSMKMETKYCIMGVSMKIYNENEKYILHFIFSYKYSTHQIIKNPCNENNANITYQVMERQ